MSLSISAPCFFRKLSYAILLLLTFPFMALSQSNDGASDNLDDLYEQAWLLFDQNRERSASMLLQRHINFVTDTASHEAVLRMHSDLLLFRSGLRADSLIAHGIKIDEEFKRDSLINTKEYLIHSARLGYYYCLSGQLAKADSLTNHAIKGLKSHTIPPRHILEIYAYRVAYLLSASNNIPIEYDYATYKKCKKKYLRDANQIISRGFKLAQRHNLQSSKFYTFLTAMRETILLGNIRVYIKRPLSDYECKYNIYNNTRVSASFELDESYQSILTHVQRGDCDIVSGLNYLEQAVQVSLQCRGNNEMIPGLYSLISELYLMLYDFPKAIEYARKAHEIGVTQDNDLAQIYRLPYILYMQSECDSIKQFNPLYDFEHALLNQGSITAQDALTGMNGTEYAIGRYLGTEYSESIFEQLINEFMQLRAKWSYLDDFNMQMLNSYHINPYVQPKVSLIYPHNPNETSYYEDFLTYAPSLDKARQEILHKIQFSTDLKEKSLLYYCLAKCYFYQNKLSESIAAQRQHLDMEIILSNINYTSEVLDAQKTLSLLYMLGMWDALQLHKKRQVEHYQNLFIKLGNEYSLGVQNYVEHHFPTLSYADQKALWAPFANWFFNTTPYMGINGRAAECLYNGALFSKGLLLSVASGNIPKYNWLDIRKQLNDGDLAIEFVNFRNPHDEVIYYAIAITPDCQAPVIYPLFSEFDYEQLGITDEQCYTSPQMYDLIFRPIEIDDKIKNIYFSPTGILHTIAIENVVDSTGTRVCDKWNTYRLTSTRELMKSSDSLADTFAKRAVIYGALDYNCSMNNEVCPSYYCHDRKLRERFRGINRATVDSLRYSKPEIDSIAALMSSGGFSTLIMTGADGTEESFKYYSQDSINIIHLSTHGFYYSDEKIEEDGLEYDSRYSFLFKATNLEPEDLAMTRSALVLSGGNNAMRGIEIPPYRDDGILTAAEISNLSMNRCDLVSLSACETALGKVSHEGVFGLQRGFKKAGVQSILMSIWEVPDKATSVLMQEFYKNLFSGQPKVEALRNAQQRLMADAEFKDPVNWAGWILLDGLD